MDKKVWEKLLLAELIFLFIFWGLNAYFQIQKDAENLYLIFIPIVLAGMLLLFVIRDRQPELTGFIRWLQLILLPIFAIFTWGTSLEYLTKNFRNLSFLLGLLFFLIFILMFLPVTVVEAGAVKWTIPRLIAIYWLMELVFDLPGDFKVYGNKFLTLNISTGLWGAITLVILACFLLKAWGFNWNPNLKFIRSNNFSWLVYVFLLIIAVYYVVLNDFGGYGDNLWQILFSFSSEPMKLTYRSFAEAAEAGILEETVRFLNIIVLLAAMHKWKHKATWAILISALMFGLMHLSNFGWQQLAPTIQQVILTFGAGLFLATLYLYTGKIWFSMLMHFSLDFLIFLQSNGDQPGTWAGDTSDWLSTIILFALPVTVYVWMLFGKRHQVLEENAERLILAK